MGSIKKLKSQTKDKECFDFNVHPLFFVFGFYYAITGKILIFVLCTLSALIHELAHSYRAEKLGYRLKRISLMPFGAVVSGEMQDATNFDEIKIAIAGPLCNLAIGFFFIALWWIFPNIYPYTDTLVEVNMSLAIVNLLPVFPLDGGRIFLATLTMRLGREKALKISRIVGIFFAVILIVLFVFSIFSTLNLSLLLFSLFIIFGMFDKKSKYQKIVYRIKTENLKRGMEYKKIGVDGEITIKKLYSMLDEKCLNEIVVFENGKVIGTIFPYNLPTIFMQDSDTKIKYLINR